jgi:hypothetical protein
MAFCPESDWISPKKFIRCVQFIRSALIHLIRQKNNFHHVNWELYDDCRDTIAVALLKFPE